MKKYATPEITDKVYAIGSVDWKRRIFDAIAPTPIGTTYNAYLVKGDDKTALIDTVHTDFQPEYSGKIDQLLGSTAVDYLIMNHAEPDHAGSIPFILDKYPATLITTKKGAELAGAYYRVPEDRIQVIKDGDTIDLGGKTLSFYPAPFIHWPETMLTYLPENKLLFSCDFFSAHNTSGLFDDDADDVLHWAKKYYGEIMMPLAKMGRMAMGKIQKLDVEMIAPSHGPIYRHPEAILEAYTRWTNQETKPKAIIVYVSMYKNTERMVYTFVEVLRNKGIDVMVFDMDGTDAGELAEHLVDARALVLASPTVLGSMHPLIQYAGIMIKTFKPPVKYGMFINSYGWGKSATNHGIEFFESAKIENIGVVEVNGAPGNEDNMNLQDAAATLADKILADG
jgi:flavorubredoxin